VVVKLSITDPTSLISPPVNHEIILLISIYLLAVVGGELNFTPKAHSVFQCQVAKHVNQYRLLAQLLLHVSSPKGPPPISLSKC
jgi:hypothetical protein